VKLSVAQLTEVIPRVLGSLGPMGFDDLSRWLSDTYGERQDVEEALDSLNEAGLLMWSAQAGESLPGSVLWSLAPEGAVQDPPGFQVGDEIRRKLRAVMRDGDTIPPECNPNTLEGASRLFEHVFPALTPEEALVCAREAFRAHMPLSVAAMRNLVYSLWHTLYPVPMTIGFKPIYPTAWEHLLAEDGL
jgi:hypothetical protein